MTEQVLCDIKSFLQTLVQQSSIRVNIRSFHKVTKSFQ